MMNIFLFNVLFVLCGWIIYKIADIITTVVVLPLLIIAKESKMGWLSAIFFLSLTIPSIIAQFYFLGLWSAFCVALTMAFTKLPSVTADWLYWLCAIGWHGSVQRKFMREQSLYSTDEQMKRAKILNSCFVSFSTLAFIVFAFFPKISTYLYGWALEILRFFFVKA
jgi:hypothetical protein